MMRLKNMDINKQNFKEIDEFLLKCDLMRPLSDDEIEALQKEGEMPCLEEDQHTVKYSVTKQQQTEEGR